MEKRTLEKVGKNKSHGLGFPSHNELGHSQDVSKIWALIGAEKFVTENLIGETEKWTNKGNDKQEEAGSL